MNIVLKKLIIDSYRLYSDAELDFGQLSGLITLLGRNEDIENFSSNSVGKSTMIDAILTVLYGENLNNTALRNNINLYTGKQPNITLELDINEDNYIIINDYNINLLQVYKNGVLIETSKKKDTFEFIKNELGLSHFLMKHLIYLSPSSSSIFSESDPTLQGKFIQQLLNLGFISDMNKKVGNDLKGLKGDIKLKVKELSLYQERVNTINKQLNLLPEIDNKDYEPEIIKISAEKARQEEYLSSCLKVEEKLKVEFNNLKSIATELKTEIRILEDNIKQKTELCIAGICPTCGNTTDNVNTNIEKESLEDLNKRLSLINEEGTVKKTELVEAEALTSKIKKDIKGLEDNLNELKRKREVVLTTESQRGARIVLQSQLEEALKDMIEIQSQLDDMENDRYCMELIYQCSSSKGFIKERIELFLHLYNIELRNLSLDLLGGGHSVTIIKDDDNKYFLEIKDGDITLNYNMLSSGFKSRMDVLLILALNKTVETLTGISINILILDEVLSAVDNVGVEAMQELLLEIQHKFPNKLVFVVSHNQELRFDKTLTIHRENNRSKFIINKE